jgi:Acetate kinase
LSKELNDNLKRGTEGRIDHGTGPQIWVVPTDEEGRIAKETEHVVDEVTASATKKPDAEAAIA